MAGCKVAAAEAAEIGHDELERHEYDQTWLTRQGRVYEDCAIHLAVVLHAVRGRHGRRRNSDSMKCAVWNAEWIEGPSSWAATDELVNCLNSIEASYRAELRGLFDAH